VPGGVGIISQSKLVCKFIKFVNVSNASVDIEITSRSSNFVKGAKSVGWYGVVVGKVV